MAERLYCDEWRERVLERMRKEENSLMRLGEMMGNLVATHAGSRSN